MDTFARLDKNSVYSNLDSIREAYIELMTNDQVFIDSIELSTSSTQAIHTRFTKWRQALENIINVAHKEPRCFSYILKKNLFDANSTCSICNQRIISIDDSAVDHIEQYWTGGKTIPENARLTHKYCNFSRARGESPEHFPPPRTKGGKRKVLPKGCTVNGIHYENANEAIRDLISKGKLKKNDLPTSAYNAHQWLSDNYYNFGIRYKRDGN